MASGVQSIEPMIGQWMTRNPLTVSPGKDLRHTVTLMTEGRVRRLPVEENGRLVGIITEADIRKRCMETLAHLDLAEREALLPEIKVGGVMTLKPVVASPETSRVEAAEMMLRKGIGGLPVIGEGRLVGMITKTDLLKGFLSLIETDRSFREEEQPSSPVPS